MKRLVLALLLISTPCYASGLNFRKSSPLNNKGDIFVRVATGDAALAVGTDGQILSADSSTLYGLKWVAAPTGGAGTPGGADKQVQFNDATSFGGDTSFQWNKNSNTLAISRDAAQSGYAIVISGDLASQGTLANISHDGSAFVQSLQVITALSVDQGAIGKTSYTKGDVLVATSSKGLTNLGVGTDGQVLSADSSTQSGLAWRSPTALTTKGDLETFGTLRARLGVGTDGQVLSADSSQPFGIKWATLASGGGGTPGSPANSIQYNSASTFAGATLITTDGVRVAIGPNTSTLISLDVAGSFRTVPTSLTGTGTTISLDASKSNFHIIRLNGNPNTLNTINNGVIGQSITVLISQDSTGTRKIGFGRTIIFGSDVPSFDASTTAGSRDYIRLTFSGVSWDVVGASKGYLP